MPNEITEQEYLFSDYSDRFKEAHGIRPHHGSGWTSDELREACDELQAQYEAKVERKAKDKADHAQAVAKAYSHTAFTIGDLVAF